MHCGFPHVQKIGWEARLSSEKGNSSDHGTEEVFWVMSWVTGVVA